MKDRPREAVLEELRQKASLLPGTNVTIGQPISHRIDHMLSGTRANIAVKIFGDDLAGAATTRASGSGRNVAGRRRRRPRHRAANRYPDNEGARGSGGSGDAGSRDRHRGGSAGNRAGRTRPSARSWKANPFPLVVRYAADDSTSLDSIGATQIQTPDRRQIPLSSVATIQEDRGPNFVMRENVQRRIVVQSNVSGRDLRSVVNDIQGRVTRNVKLPQGYHVEYGGQFESEAQASQAAPLAISWASSSRSSSSCRRHSARRGTAC